MSFFYDLPMSTSNSSAMLCRSTAFMAADRSGNGCSLPPIYHTNYTIHITLQASQYSRCDSNSFVVLLLSECR